MPRKPRIVIKGYPYHVTQRGNYKQTTFATKSDYACYLNWLDKYAKQYKLMILSYCLMPNHVHFICIPSELFSLSTTFKLTHMRYSNFFHSKHKLIGHLWQGRFYSCILDEKHLYAAIRYIENNPVRSGLVENPEDWKWSSAKYHIDGKDDNCLDLANISEFLQIDDWNDYLSQHSEKSIIENIRKNTHSGIPCGTNDFIISLENLLNINILPKSMGRPKEMKIKK
ncbi:MAG: transposase [Candidatus Omnitrophota bacterium]